MKTLVAVISLSVTVLGLAVLSNDLPAAAVEQPPIQSVYSASALYDLGNFYARIGRPAMAVLNYERDSFSRRLIPTFVRICATSANR